MRPIIEVPVDMLLDHVLTRLAPDARCRPGALREAVEAWCVDNWAHPPGARALAQALARRGCRAVKSNGVRYWVGPVLRERGAHGWGLAEGADRGVADPLA